MAFYAMKLMRMQKRRKSGITVPFGREGDEKRTEKRKGSEKGIYLSTLILPNRSALE